VQPTTTSPTVSCPDDETLGVYLEGGLSAADRANVETHVAECASCYELLVEIARALEDLPARTNSPGTLREVSEIAHRAPIPFWKRAWFVPATLAAAAALVVTVYVSPLWRFPGSQSVPEIERARGPMPDMPDVGRSVAVRSESGLNGALADLVASLGTDRFLEARLSADFAYGPRPSQRRSGSPGDDVRPETRIAAARVEKVVDDQATPQALGALGLAHLATANVDGAVTALERATRAAPDDASLQIDLAAAYLERHRRRPGRSDATGAVEAARRATGLAPQRPQGWFNLALAHQAAGNSAEARRAAAQLNLLEPSSPWTLELRARLDQTRPR
jgi:tetratricopeptide (TPR) repeat protein